jgi:hypothetical protein
MSCLPVILVGNLIRDFAKSNGPMLVFLLPLLYY